MSKQDKEYPLVEAGQEIAAWTLAICLLGCGGVLVGALLFKNFVH